jgi:hypothetical protein
MCEAREDIAKTDNEIVSGIGAGGMGEAWESCLQRPPLDPFG